MLPTPQVQAPVEALLEVAGYPDHAIASISFVFWHKLAKALTRLAQRCGRSRTSVANCLFSQAEVKQAQHNARVSMDMEASADDLAGHVRHTASAYTYVIHMAPFLPSTRSGFSSRSNSGGPGLGGQGGSMMDVTAVPTPEGEFPSQVKSIL